MRQILCIGLLIVAFCAGCSGEGADMRVAGIWYAQTLGETPLPAGVSWQLVLDIDSRAKTVTFSASGAQSNEVYAYSIDAGASTMTLTGIEADQDEIVYRYELEDDLLRLYPQIDGADEGALSRLSPMELTRTREGLPRHEELRKHGGASPFGLRDQLTSNQNLREIHKAAVAWCYAVSRAPREMPSSIGLLVSEGELLPRYALAPWSTHTIPTGFEAMPKAEQIEWIDTHTSYVYIVAGQQLTLDPKKLAVFELLPSPMRLDDVGLCYDNTSFDRVPIEEARAIVLEQTGQTLDAWADAVAPGVGRID